MNMHSAARRLIEVLRSENQALAGGDAEAAARLLPEKEEAAGALRAALVLGAGPAPDAATATVLRALTVENGERLSLAIEVQGRVLELVARAARQCVPRPSRYGRRGTMAPSAAAQALAVRA